MCECVRQCSFMLTQVQSLRNKFAFADLRRKFVIITNKFQMSYIFLEIQTNETENLVVILNNKYIVPSIAAYHLALMRLRSLGSSRSRDFRQKFVRIFVLAVATASAVPGPSLCAKLVFPYNWKL